ncbi:MAG: MBL fold metallo-hydrolase [Candidatus Hydrogenedentes bacterium]|nr:MBL fold metallo-hydrolase [Candidatus Hydrogenedentota bacterium]
MPTRFILTLLMLSLALTFASAAAADSLPFPTELVAFTPLLENPVFEGGGEGAWDENLRERGWILYEEGMYHLWYTGYPSDKRVRKQLGYATSADGLHWERYANNPLDVEMWVEDMIVVKVDGSYYMFAENHNDETHLLISKDRIHWQEEGELTILKTNGEAIDPGPFGTPTVWYEDEVWYLFYERDDEAIWLATSTDLKKWVHVQDEPVLERGPDDYDQAMIAMDQIVKYEGIYYAYFHGLIPGNWPQEWTSNVAASTDLIHWEKYSGNPIVDNDKSSPILVQHDTGYRFYTMHSEVFAYEQGESKEALRQRNQSFTVWQLPNGDMPQMMSYVIQTVYNKLIVIDGGYYQNAPYLRRFIESRGGKVEAWFLTHVHLDHCQALTDVLNNPEGLEINALYASYPDREWFEKNCDEGSFKVYEELTDAVDKSGKEVLMPAPGQVISIDGISIRVLGVCNPEILVNTLNNSSMVLRFDDGIKSVLFLADLGVEGGNKLMASPEAAYLPSDYVQMAHHGQQGVSEAVYEAIDPSYCLWPTPKWLWDNNSGAGEDSGPWQTKSVRSWMDKRPIKQHYLMFKGLQKIK